MKCQSNALLGRPLAVALAVVLSLGMAVPALAAWEADPVTGTEEHPAEAAITKRLEKLTVTSTPGVTFGFSFAKKALNNNTAEDEIAPMPGIPTQTIAFTSGEAHRPDMDYCLVGEKVIDLTDVVFPHAGAYTYTLTEQQTLYDGSIDVAKETIFYSQAAYEITFYVSEGVNGLYVSAIGARIRKNDDGTDGTGAKVDPTPGIGEERGGGLCFTNGYIKQNGGIDPTKPSEQAFIVSHAVSGDFADTSKYFEYDVGLFYDAPFGATWSCKGYILNTSGNVIEDYTKSAPNSIIKEDASGKKYIEVPIFLAIKPEQIFLKHGEKLVFTDVPVGTRYQLYIYGVEDYSTTIKCFINGLEQNPDLTFDFNNNCGIGYPGTVIGDNSPNTAAVTRIHKTIPVTGLIIDNLPFVMILIVAAAALVVFILVKSRKRRAYAAGN